MIFSNDFNDDFNDDLNLIYYKYVEKMFFIASKRTKEANVVVINCHKFEKALLDCIVSSSSSLCYTINKKTIAM